MLFYNNALDIFTSDPAIAMLVLVTAAPMITFIIMTSDYVSISASTWPIVFDRTLLMSLQISSVVCCATAIATHRAARRVTHRAAAILG